MERRHIYTGAPKHGLFGSVTSFEPDVLRSGSDHIDEEPLVFLVSPGEQAADGVNGLVLLLKQGAQICISAALGRVIHLGSDLKHRKTDTGVNFPINRQIRYSCTRFHRRERTRPDWDIRVYDHVCRIFTTINSFFCYKKPNL